MIKIEKISPDGKIVLGEDALTQGQLLDHAEYSRIKVLSGEVLVSIDELDLVTLRPEAPAVWDDEIKNEVKDEVKDEVAPAITDKPTSAAKDTEDKVKTTSANSTSAKTPKSTGSTKK